MSCGAMLSVVILSEAKDLLPQQFSPKRRPRPEKERFFASLRMMALCGDKDVIYRWAEHLV